MHLPNYVLTAVKKAGVEIWFADRSVSRVWNRDRLRGEPIRFGGWYWQQVKNGRVVSTDEEGPFRSRSAAIRDAYVKLQLRPVK